MLQASARPPVCEVHYEAFHFRRSKLPAPERAADREVHSAIASPSAFFPELCEAGRGCGRERWRRHAKGFPLRTVADRPVVGGRQVGRTRRAIEGLRHWLDRLSFDARGPRSPALLESR